MKAEIENGEIKLTDSYKYRECVKEILGRRWDGDSKAWYVPLSPENAQTLRLLGAEMSDELTPYLTERANAPPGEDEKPMLPMPIKAVPYRHQIRAYNYALQKFGLNAKGGDEEPYPIRRKGVAYLMDMG